MTAKPTLGYPSRTDAVLALRANGLSSGEIAEKIGITTATVAALEHSAGRGRKRPIEALCRTVLFPIDVIADLGPHAARRNIHPNHLARLIVETVLESDIVDAVLDDA